MPVYTIKKFSMPGIAKFVGLIGFVWGFLAGLILMASYLVGYMEKGDLSLIQTGLFGFCLMLVYGVAGGIIGGAVIAFVYNNVLGTKHGIRMELDSKV